MFDLLSGPRGRYRQGWIGQGELSDEPFPMPEPSAEVTLDGARFNRVDFSGLRFASFNSVGSLFEGCDFSGAAFDELFLGSGRSKTAWPQSVFRDCLFRRTRLASRTFFGNVRFERCVFDRARTHDHVHTFQAEFVDCTFLGRVRAVNFWGSLREDQDLLGRDRNEFAGNDFTGAEVSWVAFNGIDLLAQRFPGPPDHALLDRVSVRAAAAAAVVDGWPDPAHRDEGRFDLEFLASNALGSSGGRVLLHRSELGTRLPPELRDQLFDALAAQTHNQQ